jgi:hypothetical protein
METRQELLLKFMLAVAAQESTGDGDRAPHRLCRLMFCVYAEALVDRYYEVLR